MLNFCKYHALGNDYLVVEGDQWRETLAPSVIRRICHRNLGIGSNGILVRLPVRDAAQFRVQIWNPDGSEAEKSGNGLRIFARYLWDQQSVADEPFTVETTDGTVHCRVSEQGRSVTVDMGAVSFDSLQIPVQGPPREVLRETIVLDGREFEYSAATIGNPHCVLLCEHALADEARVLGPLIETDPRFPNRTNVQFVEVVDRHRITIEIWERGAGYTLASGSSSCAAAAVVVRLGLCDSPLSVRMPGGTLTIAIDECYQARMMGPVCKVADGRLCQEALDGATLHGESASFTLIPFEARYAEIVLKWVLGREEAAAWAGVNEAPLDPSIFAQWHIDPEIHASILLRDGAPVGYGELWMNFDTDAVELARLIVAPSVRGRGIGRILIERLSATPAAAASKKAFLRVRPGNKRAIRCYEWAAFRRISAEQERRYNIGQPVEYIWMSREMASAT